MAFPTSEERILEAEAKLGVRLPAEYRNRLVANNGGELSTSDDDWQVFPVFDPSDRKRAARTANHLVREHGLASQSHGFPDNAIAVAANGSGDLLVFLRGPQPGTLGGRLYVWNHETAECVPTALDYG